MVLAPDIDAVRSWFPGAVSLREEPLPHVILRVNHLELDLTARGVRWGDRRLDLTAHEFDLLAALAEDPGRVWTFGDLVTRVWGSTFYGDLAAVHSAVKRLRKKLRQSGLEVGIESVRGIGFRLAATSSRLKRFIRRRSRTR